MAPSFSDFHAQQIQADLDWRETELAVLRRHLLSTTVGSTQEVTFLRTNLAMIYAHYEGFCKFALGVYVDALTKLALNPMDLKWPIAVQSFRKLQAELKNIDSPAEFFSKLLTEFEAGLTEPANYERPDSVANLWPDLLASWLERFNLDSTTVAQEKVRLDRLVTSRNQIAHGKKLTVANRSELDLHANAATLAMHAVAVGVMDALEQKRYARSSRVMTILSHATH